MSKPVFAYLDNNRIAHKRLENMFTDMADVLFLSSFSEAESYLESKPDVQAFFVEYQLKTRTGLHFARLVRSMERYDAVPIFLLTPMVNDMLAYKAMRVGINECVSKMISAQALQQLVSHHLETPQVKRIKRPYYEVTCVSWQKDQRFYQFCPDIELTVSADSAAEASQKMKMALQQMIHSREKLDFEFIETYVELHRIIPPRE